MLQLQRLTRLQRVRMSDLVLTRIGSARHALAEARTIQDAKRIADIAEAARVYAQRSKAGRDVEMEAAEIVVRAERLLGEMLAQTNRNIGGNPDLTCRRDLQVEAPKLSELGITRELSSRAQSLAAIPAAFFESTVEAKKQNGDLSRAALITAANRSEKIAGLQVIAAKTPQTIDGVFDVLVIDPPWPLEKYEREVRPNQIAFDYPTMTEEELLAWPLGAEKAARDCHLFLWTTHKFLPLAFQCLAAWAFKYTCTFVWHKPGGIQPLNFPQLNCEFCLYGRKGNPLFVDLKAFNACFDAQRGAHSEKPEEFYSLIRRVTAGRRLDMFSRRQIEGFVGWGKEAAVNGLSN